MTANPPSSDADSAVNTAFPPAVPVDDGLIEQAILGVVAQQAEIYPVHLVREVCRRDPALSPTRIWPVLERLCAERRLARLWHRYLLPERIEPVRSKWLAEIELRQAGRAAQACAYDGYANSRAILLAWDGWQNGEATG